MESCLLTVIEIHFVYGLELITLCIIKLIIRKAYGFRNIQNYTNPMVIRTFAL